MSAQLKKYRASWQNTEKKSLSCNQKKCKLIQNTIVIYQIRQGFSKWSRIHTA